MILPCRQTADNRVQICVSSDGIYAPLLPPHVTPQHKQAASIVLTCNDGGGRSVPLGLLGVVVHVEDLSGLQGLRAPP